VQKYELIFILKVTASESVREALIEKVQSILSAHEGEITQQNHWGVRRLAYEIAHENKGNYMFVQFRSQGTAVTELDKLFRLDDRVLRHMVVRDDEWEERNRKAQRQRKKDDEAARPA